MPYAFQILKHALRIQHTKGAVNDIHSSFCMLFSIMPAAGLEPARGCPRQILSLMRLPFRHAGSLAIGSLRLAHARFIISYPPSYCNHIFHFSHLTPSLIPLTKIIIYDNFIADNFLRNTCIFRRIEGFMKEQSPLTPRYEVVEQLKSARKAQNVTQEVLAERVGTKKSNISRFESGRYNPSLDFLIKVADSLGKQIQIRIR